MSDIDVVAGTCWGEARSLGELGMNAVCNVIMNRVAKQSWYGLTPTEVCLKNRHGVYQFDCNSPDDPNCAKIAAVTDADPQYKIALRLATDAINGNLPDVTRGALNYYSTSVPLPSWALDKTPSLIIGNTQFFNNID